MTFFCKNCGQELTDEIRFDLGWHCDYPCDTVTHDEDVGIKMKEVKATDESHFVDLFLNTERPFTIWVPDDFNYTKMHKILQERGIFLINTNIDCQEGFICQRESSDQELDSKS